MNTTKTEVLVSAKGEGNRAVIKDRCNKEIKQVEKFCYLGTTISETGGGREEVKMRVKRAWGEWREASGIAQEADSKVESKNLQECDTPSPTAWYGSPCTEKIRRETV